MGFLGGLIRAGVSAGGGALRGANTAEQTNYERERQRKQDALQAMLLNTQIENTASDNQRADAQLEQNARQNALAEVTAKRRAMLDAQAVARAESEAPPLPVPDWQKQGYPDFSTWRRDQQMGKINPNLPAGGPAPKPLPASVKKAMATNQQTLNSIDEAIAAIEKNPDALHGWDTFAPEVVRKFSETPDKVTVRAPVADVGSLQIHDRTGANMNIKEEPRLAPFVPDIRDRPANALIKLRRLKQRIAETNDALSGGGGSLPDDAPQVNGDYQSGDDPATMRMADRFEEIRAANPGLSAAQITQMVKDEFSRKSR